MTTCTYNDPYAGPVAATLVPMPSDKSRFWWKRENGQVCGGMARALPKARAIAYAKAHRSFSNIQEAPRG